MKFCDGAYVQMWDSWDCKENVKMQGLNDGPYVQMWDSWDCKENVKV